MKNNFIKAICIICSFTLFFISGQLISYADDSDFVSISIIGFDENGNEIQKDKNVFYIKNNVLYAPINILEKYSMYDYDNKNSAFVRVGQEFKKANSKLVVDYNNNKINVFYERTHKETYDMNILNFANTYFFPLDEMAAYLKASIIYKEPNTISIVNSGISICDALYDFNIYNSSLNYDKLVDEIFVGSEELYIKYSVLGYVGNTIFSFKVKNLFGSWGDNEKYCTILENAVTNTSVYDDVMKENTGLKKVSEFASNVYEKIYKKAAKIYSLSDNSITTMFNEYKELNSFGDESPFDNFFPDEQIEIDKINAIGKKIKIASQFLEIAEYLHDFYSMNSDNRDALKVIFNESSNDNIGLAIKEIQEKYSNSFVESAYIQISKKVADECAEEVASSVFENFNKVKLATSIVNSVFKTFGFDLSDNSSYDILLADELSNYFIKKSSAIELGKYNTISDSEDVRLTLIMLMLVNIEGYKLGNKAAKRISEYDDHFKSEIEEHELRLALLYLANDSKYYESVEGIKKIIEQNRNQISKLSLNDLKELDNKSAEALLNGIENNANLQDYVKPALIDLVYNLPKYSYEFNDTSIGFEIIDLNSDNVPEVIFSTYYGATAIPSIEEIFEYRDGVYVKCNIDFKENAYPDFPIIPKRDSAGELAFLGYFRTAEELNDFTEPPDFASFWHYYSIGVSEIYFSNGILTSKLIADYTSFRNLIDGDNTEVERKKAWDEYKKEVAEFNSEYHMDSNYNAVIITNISTGFIDSELSVVEQLDTYHETVNEAQTQLIAETYYSSNGFKEICFDDIRNGYSENKLNL